MNVPSLLLNAAASTGYMQTTYWDNQWMLTAKDNEFGTRVHEKTLGNLHDHLTSWKVKLLMMIDAEMQLLSPALFPAMLNAALMSMTDFTYAAGRL